MPVPVASRAGRVLQRSVRAAPYARTGDRAVLALLALTLAACVQYQARPLDPAASAQAFAARRLDAPPVRAAVQPLLPIAALAWPPPRWDRGSLLAVALVQNPQLAVARAEVRAALAHEISAAEAPNPDLTLQSEYARSESHSWLYGISLDVLLRTPARKRLDVDIARLASASARWQMVEQVWTVRRALISALGDWEYAQRRGDLLDRLLAEQRQLVVAQQQRVDAGEDTPSELIAARTALLEAQQQRAQLRVDAVSAQAALAAALGLPAQALDGLRVDWPDWGAPPPLDQAMLHEAREHALLTRADLAAVIGDYAAAEKKLQRAIARQYPEFHLQPGYYWDHGVAKWPLDLAFALPIFNRNQGEIAEARAARELAGQRLLALQARIQGEIDAALRVETVAAANAAAATQRVGTANEQLRQARLGLQLGAIDRAQRIGVEVIALRAEVDALQARAQRQLARNALEDAVHAPLSGPERALRHALDDAASPRRNAVTSGTSAR